MAVSDLVTAFEARVPSSRVVQLTNPKDKNASTKNATQLTNAATDAFQLFKVICGVVLDTDDDKHIMAGVRVMHAFLLYYAASTSSEAMRILEDADKICERVAMTEGRDTILATSNSQVNTTRDRDALPYFDPKHFDGLRADNPTGGEISDPLQDTDAS